ncbi:proline iminopeptidase-family hydrolase [soil metagenome]
MSSKWLLLGLVAACAAPEATLSAPSPQREGFVTTEDGIRLAFRVEGIGADTVVVLHGGPGMSGEGIRPDLAPFGRDFTFITYDQRGSGHSTHITDSTRISLAHHVADLESVRRHFRLERMALAGHSWGGGLALHYALAYPEGTELLVLIDPMPLRRDPYMAQFGRNLRAWMDSTTREQLNAAARARANAADPVAACRAYWDIFIRGYLADPLGSGPIRGDACFGTVETLNNRVNRYTLGPLGAWDWRQEARNVRAPALIVHGAMSPLPAESFREWADALPNGNLVAIESSGHFPHAEQPTAFLEAMRAFVQSRLNTGTIDGSGVRVYGKKHGARKGSAAWKPPV